MHLSSLYSKLGPKLGNFGKYTLPLTFSKFNTKDTVINTRKPGYCTIFDVSHMGIFETTHKNIIQDTFSMNLSKNRSKLGVLLNKHGGVIDDVIIGDVDNSKHRLVVNANTKQIYRQMDELIEKKNKVILAIQGQYSQSLIETIFAINLDDTYFMQNKTIYKDSIEICRCGYTGEDGFELYIDSNLGIEIYKYLIELSNNNENILFGGLIERDLLRLEAGMSLSGIEFGEDMNINFKDLDMDFLIDKKYRTHDNFVSNYKRVGFINNKPIKKGGIYNMENESVGFITSSNKSFNLNKFIGIGYLNRTAYNEKINGNMTLVKLPFIKPNYYKQ
jgi:aminomethyltransferase